MTAGIGAVGGAGGSVSALAQAYRNQLLAAADPSADGTAAAGSTGSGTPGGDFAGALGQQHDRARGLWTRTPPPWR